MHEGSSSSHAPCGQPRLEPKVARVEGPGKLRARGQHGSPSKYELAGVKVRAVQVSA